MPSVIKSGQSKTSDLSVTEGERSAGVLCAQYMIYAMRIFESMKLKVKKPMKLHVDNKGVVDLAKNWSVDDMTRYYEIKDHFLRELKQ